MKAATVTLATVEPEPGQLATVSAIVMIANAPTRKCRVAAPALLLSALLHSARDYSSGSDEARCWRTPSPTRITGEVYVLANEAASVQEVSCDGVSIAWEAFTLAVPLSVPHVEVTRHEQINSAIRLKAPSPDVTNGWLSFDGWSSTNSTTTVEGLVAHINLHNCPSPLTLEQCTPFALEVCPEPTDTENVCTEGSCVFSLTESASGD